MKALSMKQPWAWLVCAGIKDIENRNWHTKFRGRIYVHTGLSKSDMTKEILAMILNKLNGREASDLMLVYNLLTFGAIIGEVDITDCVWSQNIGLPTTKSRWFFGTYGFILANPVLYDKPIPCKGMLGFFTPEL